MDSVKIVGKYRVWLDASYAPRTSSQYEQTLWRFLRDTKVPIDRVTEQDVAAWLEQYPFRSSARKSYHGALTVFFAWARRNGYVDTNPIKDIRAPAPAVKAPRALTRDELDLVLRAAASRSPMRAYAIAFLYYSGARQAEMLAVEWRDILADGVLLRKTKNGKERKIPWSAGLRTAVEGLRSYFGEQDLILPRSHQTLWLWCRQAGAEAGIPNVHPHLFRSTHATIAMRGGARIHAVSANLGHADMKTTSRYVAPNEADMQAAVALL